MNLIELKKEELPFPCELVERAVYTPNNLTPEEATLYRKAIEHFGGLVQPSENLREVETIVTKGVLVKNFLIIPIFELSRDKQGKITSHKPIGCIRANEVVPCYKAANLREELEKAGVDSKRLEKIPAHVECWVPA